jgi:phosphopantothenoylcysteine decarboxylase/phosphopantothenate--cysteine ligase
MKHENTTGLEFTMDPFFLDLHEPFFKGKKILLGVTGSIAAFKAIEIARILVKLNAQVRVVLSESAHQFVTPLTFQAITNQPVYSSMWSAPAASANSDQSSLINMNHIELARWADLILVAPATANVISELAHGGAGSLLTTEILASKVPVVVAPAMNPTMYQSKPVQENLRRLHHFGYHVMDAKHGATACGDEGVGRMMEPVEIIERLCSFFCATSKSKSVLISLGPTRTYLDPVRYFTNRSSGKMGAAMAYQAVRLGYHVHVIAGPCDVPLPKLARISRVVTTDEMAGAVLEAFQDTDIFVSTAAVLDLEFEKTFDHKLKKTDSDRIQSKIEFVETVDILKSISAVKNEGKRRLIIGFAAETDHHQKNAETKLVQKNCDAVFVNPVEASHSGFETNQNQGIFVYRDRQGHMQNESYSVKTKSALALDLWTKIGDWLDE